MSLFVFSCRCMCSNGYTGQNCESEYIPCEPSPCENGGSCLQLGEHAYECICPEGEYKQSFFLYTSYRAVKSCRATAPNPAKDETFHITHISLSLLASLLHPNFVTIRSSRSSRSTKIIASFTRHLRPFSSRVAFFELSLCDQRRT